MYDKRKSLFKIQNHFVLLNALHHSIPRDFVRGIRI